MYEGVLYSDNLLLIIYLFTIICHTYHAKETV